MLESQADSSPYPCLKVLTTPCKIRAPFHDLAQKIPLKTITAKEKESRTNQCSCGFPAFCAIVQSTLDFLSVTRDNTIFYKAVRAFHPSPPFPAHLPPGCQSVFWIHVYQLSTSGPGKPARWRTFRAPAMGLVYHMSTYAIKRLSTCRNWQKHLIFYILNAL